MYHTNLQQIKWVGRAMVKMQHINIKTAINIQKTCIPLPPPQKSSATERRGTDRVAIVSTGAEKSKNVKF